MPPIYIFMIPLFIQYSFVFLFLFFGSMFVLPFGDDEP